MNLMLGNLKTIIFIIIAFLLGLFLGYYFCKYGLRLPSVNVSLPSPTPTISTTPTPKEKTFTPIPTPTPTFVPPGLEKK